MRPVLFLGLLVLVGCDAFAPSSPSLSPMARASATVAERQAAAPTHVRTRRGTDSGTPASALATADLSGTDTDPALAIDLTPTAGRYLGDVWLRSAPGALATATDIRLDARTAGVDRSVQRWRLQVLDGCTSRWVTVGANPDRTAGEWTDTSFEIGLAGECVADARGRIRVRAKTVGNQALAIDYLAVSYEPAASADWWQPGPGVSWQWQLAGTLDTSLDVEMYDIDLFDTSQATIDALHADGRIVVCYFSAGSWEEWRDDAGDFPTAVRGRDLDGWDGEQWLDIRDLATLGPIMEARLDVAAAKNCDAVEPDNVDGYTNNSGFALTYGDQIAYNRFLASAAHARGLSVGLKNDVDQIPDLVADFDWALNEECFAYDECETLLPFIEAGKAVFTVEYEGNPASFCPQANAWDFDTLKKRLSLNAWRQACR